MAHVPRYDVTLSQCAYVHVFVCFRVRAMCTGSLVEDAGDPLGLCVLYTVCRVCVLRDTDCTASIHVEV